MGPAGVVSGALELGARTAAAGNRKQRRSDIQTRAGDRVQCQLGRSRETPRRRDRVRAPKLGSCNIRQPVPEPGDQLRRGMIPVVPFVQPKVLHPEVGCEIDNQAGSGVNDFRRELGGLAMLEGQKDDVAIKSDFYAGGAADYEADSEPPRRP